MTTNTIRELNRLKEIGEVTASRMRKLYLKQTKRLLHTELCYLRSNNQGPKFIVGTGVNGHVGFYYRFSDVVSWFGGEAAFVHRDDAEWKCSSKPSATHFKRRATV